eukprot:Gb_09662 [translate_table: standard]
MDPDPVDLQGDIDEISVVCLGYDSIIECLDPEDQVLTIADRDLNDLEHMLYDLVSQASFTDIMEQQALPKMLLMWQDAQHHSSDSSELIPQHNYKLDAHALNSRHPGELETDEVKFMIYLSNNLCHNCP